MTERPAIFGRRPGGALIELRRDLHREFVHNGGYNRVAVFRGINRAFTDERLEALARLGPSSDAGSPNLRANLVAAWTSHLAEVDHGYEPCGPDDIDGPSPACVPAECVGDLMARLAIQSIASRSDAGSPIDVERLARAIHNASGDPGEHDGYREDRDHHAAEIAAEYARLAAEGPADPEEGK